MSKTYCGIDVGKKGAISFLWYENNNVYTYIYDMPVIGKKNEYNTKEIIKLFQSFKPDLVILEKQQAMPGQGRTSMFTIGYGMGLLEGIIVTLDISYIVVHPKTWQAKLEIKSGDIKTKVFQYISKRFPKAILTGSRGGIKDGRADAIAMALYGKLINEGEKK